MKASPISRPTAHWTTPATTPLGLARYQLIIGKPHPVTTAITRMHPDDQDTIDDFLLEAARSGFSLRGQLLSGLIQQAIHGTVSPTEQQVSELLPSELLKMARRWQRGELEFKYACQKTI